jgi:hypothetical protein
MMKVLKAHVVWRIDAEFPCSAMGSYPLAQPVRKQAVKMSVQLPMISLRGARREGEYRLRPHSQNTNTAPATSLLLSFA